MRTLARYMLLVLVALVMAASTTGCIGGSILGPPKKAMTVFYCDLPERCNFYAPDGKVYEAGPNDMWSFYLPTSVITEVRITKPDGRLIRTIRVEPDAELGDATGPNGLKADTWVYFSGRVIR